MCLRINILAVAGSAILVALWTCSAGGSEDVNADDWAAWCESSNGLMQGVCLGSVASAVDMIETHGRNDPAHRMVCWNPAPPTNIATLSDSAASSLGRLARVAIRYLRANPTYDKMPSPALMLAAFMREWPCGQVGPLK
jgi:hypothetical protein